MSYFLKKNYLTIKKQYGGEYNTDMISYLRKISNIILGIEQLIELQNRFDLNNLFITNNLTYIQDIYTKYNYLELRKYNGEKKLIIGCGNKRLDNCNLDFCPSDPSKKFTKEHQENVNLYHSHLDAYTIDACIVANPSIVCGFNDATMLPTIPDNSFDIIIFEGGGDGPYNPEIKRLLNCNKLSFCCLTSNPPNLFSYWYEGKYYENKNPLKLL